MKCTFISMSLIAPILFMACQKNETTDADKNGLHPLSALELARFKETAFFVGEVAGGWDGNATASLAAPAQTNGKAQVSKLVTERCQITPKLPEKTSPDTDFDNHVTGFATDIAGDGCPIAFQSAYHSENKLDRATGQMSTLFTINLKFKSTADPAVSAFDVSLYELSLGFKASGHRNLDGTGNFEGAGQIVSKTYGLIKIAVSGSLFENFNGSSVVQTVLFTYADKQMVELKSVTTSPFNRMPETIYLMNGDRIDEQVYLGFMMKFRLLQGSIEVPAQKKATVN